MSAPDDATAPLLSVVVPVFNEEDTLEELHRRLSEVLGAIGGSYEVILVNDGSRDRTGEILGRICRPGGTFRAVHFSRNFGHQAAVAAGLRHTTGRAIVVMDADLQDPPELVHRLLERWRDGYQVVYAQHATRENEGPLKRGAAYLFYRLLQRLTPVKIPSDTGDFCLMDRQVVEVLNSMPERNRYVRGLRAWIGFRQTAVVFDRPARFAGEAKYTFRKSLALALDGVISFSKTPLRLATYLGFVVSALSFLLGVAFVIQRFTVGFEIRGWASTVVIVLFLGGVQLLTVGIIGEYLSRIYDEVKQRPLYVVADRDNFEAGVPEAARRTSGRHRFETAELP